MDGLLVVNGAGEWTFPCDQEDFGQGVYCSPVDGKLRVAPAVRSSTPNSSGSRAGATVANGDTDVIDTIDITLTNPSTCHFASALVTFEVDVQVVLDPGDSYRIDLDGDRYLRFTNAAATVLNTVSWQVARSRVFSLTPGQVLPVSVPVELTAQGGPVAYTVVNWRANGIIVSTP